VGGEDKRELAFLSGGADRGIGSWIDDEIGLERVERVAKSFRPRQIKVCVTRRNDRPESGQAWLQRASDLSAGSRQQDPHQTCP
jgi:hypothetical protein